MKVFETPNMEIQKFVVEDIMTGSGSMGENELEGDGSISILGLNN